MFGSIEHVLYHTEKRDYAMRKCLFLEFMKYVHKFADQELLV